MIFPKFLQFLGCCGCGYRELGSGHAGSGVSKLVRFSSVRLVLSLNGWMHCTKENWNVGKATEPLERPKRLAR